MPTKDSLIPLGVALEPPLRKTTSNHHREAEWWQGCVGAVGQVREGGHTGRGIQVCVGGWYWRGILWEGGVHDERWALKCNFPHPNSIPIHPPPPPPYTTPTYPTHILTLFPQILPYSLLKRQVEHKEAETTCQTKQQRTRSTKRKTTANSFVISVASAAICPVSVTCCWNAWCAVMSCLNQQGFIAQTLMAACAK